MNNDDMATPRWVAANDFDAAAAAITAHMASVRMLPAPKRHLEEVLLELDAARARGVVFPEALQVGITAHRPPDGHLPIHISNDEADSLRAVLGLPDSFTSALHGGTSDDQHDDQRSTR